MHQKTWTKLGLISVLLSGLIGIGAQAESLIDIRQPVCSSMDADHADGTPPMSPNCHADTVDGVSDTLEITLRASNGPITIGDYAISNAFLYNDAYIPEVWRLDPGDTLAVSFENALTDEDGILTNLHTHGMIVSPNNVGGTDLSKPLGDNVLPLISNGAAVPHPLEDGDVGNIVSFAQADDSLAAALGFICRGGSTLLPVLDRTANYSIPIARDHPKGLFWYHPHPHGTSEEQIGGGLAGLMTVGRPDDYIDWDGETGALEHRLMMLKDIQLTRESGATEWGVFEEPDWRNCQNDDPDKPIVLENGVCRKGEDLAWLFTINGQLYPTIEVDEGTPQIWSIANTSANVTYALELVEQFPDGTERQIPFQVVSFDGVAVGQDDVNDVMWRSSMLVMPSARVEIYVSYDDGTARRVPGEGATAVLRQAGFLTALHPGAGDTWPPIDLAEVRFVPTETVDPAPHYVAVTGAQPTGVEIASVPSGDEDCPRLGPDEVRFVSFDVKEYAAGLQPALDFPVPPNCPAQQPDGTFFNIIGTGVGTVDDTSSLEALIAAYDQAIGMTYAADLNGEQVPTRGKCFNAALDTCVPYPSEETWWIVNPSGAAHNFHLHQSRFQVVEVVGAAESFTPNPNVWHDNYPVLAGQAVKLRIPFNRPEQIGTYVYHCHILQHEDQGMMALIEVRETDE